MKNIRIIPRLDVKNHNLVKGINLEGLRVLGLPEKFSQYYYKNGADELIYIDMVASLYGRNHLEKIVKRTAQNVFIPIVVGGGIRTVEDIYKLLRAGADKVAINTQAIKNPKLIEKAAKTFGSQCIVISIQAMKISEGKYEAYTDTGREPTGKDVIEWAKQVVDLGAGELLITSIDQEGTCDGYDIDLFSKISDSVNIPVIACGGAGKKEHILEVINNTNVDAVSASSIFHYHIVQKFGAESRNGGNIEYIKDFIKKGSSILTKLSPVSVSQVKQYLKNNNINVVLEKFSKKIVSNPIIKKKSVTIVDYGLGNIFSVIHALENVGTNIIITNNPSDIKKSDYLVIAGVGAFGDGTAQLKKKQLIDPIIKHVYDGKPLLGICLGMQLFMEIGEEFGIHEGLKLIKGKTIKLSIKGKNIKLPHIGWNRLIIHKDINILNNIPSNSLMYFVHSYFIQPEDKNLIAAETTYGENTFCSVINKDNIFGCQFHPEKSGEIGLKIYKNFIEC